MIAGPAPVTLIWARLGAGPAPVALIYVPPKQRRPVRESPWRRQPPAGSADPAVGTAPAALLSEQTLRAPAV